MKVDIVKTLAEEQKERAKKLAKEPPIPCLGVWTNTTNGCDFDCQYPDAHFICEDCIVNGGRWDPRTGRKTRRK